MKRPEQLEVWKLRRQYGGDPVKDRIQAFYRKVAHNLRELEAYKIAHGYCTAGISCMKKVVSGRACAHHSAARKAGIKLARWTVYETEYGRLRKQEIEREKIKSSRRKSVRKKRAA